MLTTKEAAEKLGVSVKRVQALLVQGRIVGALRFGNAWAIPDQPKILPGTRTRPGKIKTTRN